VIQRKHPALKALEQFLYVIIVLLIRLTGDNYSFPVIMCIVQLFFCHRIVHYSLEANTTIRHRKRHSLELEKLAICLKCSIVIPSFSRANGDLMVSRAEVECREVLTYDEAVRAPFFQFPEKGMH